MTLYELKEKLATVGNQLKNVEEQLVNKAANPAVTKEEIEELKNKKADLQQRFELLKEQHDKVEKEQQAKIKQENPISVVENEEGKLIAAKAELIRAAVEGRPMSDEARNVFACPSGTATLRRGKAPADHYDE